MVMVRMVMVVVVMMKVKSSSECVELCLPRRYVKSHDLPEMGTYSEQCLWRL